MAPVPAQSKEISFLHPKVLLLSAALTTGSYYGFRFYRHHLRRIRTFMDLTPRIFENQIKLHGKVTRVGDGDNFRFYHTPGGYLTGWNWLRQVPTNRSELKDQTLSIRLCGVDAPERLHFGNPAQPYSEEALVWLKNYVDGKNVIITPFSQDQYKRVVARAQIWKWFWKKDVSAEMLKEGLAVVYEGKTTAEFGDNEQLYRRLEENAKKKKIGIWSLKKHITPGEYKRSH